MKFPIDFDTNLIRPKILGYLNLYDNQKLLIGLLPDGVHVWVDAPEERCVPGMEPHAPCMEPEEVKKFADTSGFFNIGRILVDKIGEEDLKERTCRLNVKKDGLTVYLNHHECGYL